MKVSSGRRYKRKTIFECFLLNTGIDFVIWTSYCIRGYFRPVLISLFYTYNFAQCKIRQLTVGSICAKIKRVKISCIQCQYNNYSENRSLPCLTTGTSTVFLKKIIRYSKIVHLLLHWRSLKVFKIIHIYSIKFWERERERERVSERERERGRYLSLWLFL